MSSILKALKKLEEEQAGRSASSPTGSSGQFVAPMRAGQPLLLLMFGIGAGLLLAGGLYALLGRSEDKASPPSVSQERHTDVPAAKAPPIAASAVATTLPPKAPVRLTPPVATSAQSIAEIPVTPRPAVNIAPASSENRPRPVVAASEPSALRVAAEPRSDSVEQVQVERREIPAPGQQWSAPLLAVSEILPTSAGGRMAIVNGMPVMEGTMVDGVLVEKIGVDQVIFVVGDRSVAVPLLPQQPAAGRP